MSESHVSRIANHPDLTFADYRHAYVTGLIAAELVDSDVFAVDLDTAVPVIRIRVGPHRYELIVTELQ